MENGLVIGIGAAFIAILILISILDSIKNRGKTKTVKELEEERLAAEPEIITLHAEVIDMICGVNTVGHKTPKALKYFVIKFKADDGNILNIPVPEESYDGFDVGLAGELTLINGEIGSFVPDDYDCEEK